MAQKGNPLFHKKTFVYVCLVLFVFAGLLRLSYWQWQRAAFKVHKQQKWAQHQQGLVHDQDSLLKAHPEHWQGFRASVHGYFEPQHQFIWQNRVYQHQAGVNMIVPFRLLNGHLLLVDRGWYVKANTHLPSGEQKLEGVLVWPSRGLLLGENLGEGWPKTLQVWAFDDVKKALGVEVLPLLLHELKSGELASDYKPEQGLSPEKHKGYAVQWLLLAFTWLSLSVWYYRRALHEQ